MTWKIVNISNPGTSVKFGADDTDKISRLFSAVDVDDVTLNADVEVQKGVVIKSQSEPSSPASGKITLYFDSGDSRLKYKRSDGSVVVID